MNIAIQLKSYVNTENLSPDCQDGEWLEKFNKPLTVTQSLNAIRHAKNARHSNQIYDAVGENDTVIVYSNFFYDVQEKIKIFIEELGLTVIYSDSRGEECPVEVSGPQMVQSNIVDIMNFLEMRVRRDNVLFFSVNAVWRHGLPYLIRSFFPEVKIISYMFDWLSLFCPEQHKSYLQKYLSLPMACIESEYEVYNQILSGEIADGIVYKDGGEDISTLKTYPRPWFYMPVFLPERLHQSPPEAVATPNKFVFMGKIFSPSDHGPELFRDGYFFDIIKQLAKKGYYTDIYYVRSSSETLNYYSRYLQDVSDHVNLIQGKALDELLPQVARKYHWGYLINNYIDDYKIYEGQVAIGLPSRLLSYVALNIPIVINRQLTFAARLVEENGIGVVITLDDLPRIDSILKQYDYSELIRNVTAFRNKHSFSTYRQNFGKFVKEVMTEERIRY